MTKEITSLQAMRHPTVVATINVLSETTQRLQDEIDELKAALAKPEQKSYAGVKMWVGNQQVVQCLTQTELHYATQPWLHMLMNAEKCIAALKEKNT